MAARDLTQVVLAAFEHHRLMAIGESHGQQESGDAQQMLLADPRLPQVVDDIVVEFGNALYQPIVDRFVAGAAVDDHVLRQVWRDTTQSPGAAGDQPIREQFFRTVRAVNWTLPARRRIRVLLGDPPIDWSRITTHAQVDVFLAPAGHPHGVPGETRSAHQEAPGTDLLRQRSRDALPGARTERRPRRSADRGTDRPAQLRDRKTANGNAASTSTPVDRSTRNSAASCSI